MDPKLYPLLYLLFVSTFVASQTIVRNLPGYSGDLPFQLETGYVGVGDSENVQLFYYFLESERNPVEDPLVLWLTGGPGCSSFFGLAFEVGPVFFPDAKWKGTTVHDDELPSLGLNPYSWKKFLNMIFLDAPVGTGFSYAKTPEAYETVDSLQAERPSVETLENLGSRVRLGMLQDESNYAGRGETCTKKVNVQNILEHSCYNFSEPLDPEVESGWNLNHKLEKNFISLLRVDPRYLNFPRIPSCWKHNYMYAYHWANNPGVQKALHIREGSVQVWVKCNTSMRYLLEVPDAVVYHRNLITKGYRIFIYSGDHDLSLPHTSMEAWIEGLNLTMVDDWRPWFVEDEIAGYSMEYSGEKCRLTYAIVKGAGHTATEHKAEECFAMVSGWFSHNSL